jgi:hypothetical protein
MSVRTDVLLWANRVVARKSAHAYQILEIAADAGLDVAQEAFHKIARLAHPDLHRMALSPDELELVTTAYARAAAAYQDFRGQRQSTARLRPIPGGRDGGRDGGRGGGSTPALVLPTDVIPISASPNKAVSVPAVPAVPAVPDDQPVNPAQAMTSRALIYYRKAELCLRRGELTGAVLQLKMAIASDPQSQFLRSALAEVEAEVGKKP